MSYSPEQYEAMASKCEGVFEGDHPGDMAEAAKMLRSAATLRQQAARVDEENPFGGREKEAVQLAAILDGMTEGSYMLETLYEYDQGDGDPFVARAADLLREFAALEAALSAQPAAPVGVPDGSFQARVSEWMGQCFLPSLYSNMTERGDRLLEEVLELLQSKGYDRSRVATLVDYVWGRPVGEPAQEVGGVMVTLAGFCWIAGLDMHDAGETELARINQPEVMEKIRRKQQAKNALHFDTPLPGFAAAPSAPQGSVQKERK